MLPIFMFLHGLSVDLRQLERILRSVMGYKQFELDAVAIQLSYELPYGIVYGILYGLRYGIRYNLMYGIRYGIRYGILYCRV